MTTWYSINELNIDPNDPIYSLLCAYKLSSALRSLCATLTVQVITQQLTTATAEEQSILKINEKQSFIREVYLMGDEKPLVHARVVVPFNAYQQYKNEFDNLGTKFLGESFIYKQIHTRSDFLYTRVNNQYIRRSVFTLNECSILVQELFALIRHY